MSKFKAKSELNINKNNLPLDEQNGIEKADNNVLDLSKNTIQQLWVELDNTINSGTPMFLWSKRRLNEKIKLDNEKQVYIYEKIKNLRAIADEFAKLKADAIFSQEFIENLVAEKRMLAEQFFESAIAKHKNEIATIEVNTTLVKSQITHDDLALKDKEADIRLKNAKARQEEMKAEESEVKISIIKKAIGEIEFTKLPPVYQTYILTAFLNMDISQMT